MATLLLELFSEEIPSRMQRGAAEQLQRLITTAFEKNMLKATEVKTFVSPRHLAIQCFGLPMVQPDVKEERRGPKIGAPEQAVKGFLQSTGLTVEQCEQRDGYYYATIERKGRAVAEVIKEICEQALKDFSWPKSMRWGSRPLTWVRPLHRITCLLDDKIVPLQFAHLTATNITEGHRFLAPAAITIPHAEKYEQLLLDAKVIVDYSARKEKIRAGVAEIAAQRKLQLVDDEDLLNEVTGLVEWPVPLLCQFDKKFLDLPPEVLISEMKNHQRYFNLRSADGKLADKFITIANMVNADGGAKVKEGNARVVRARLADGEFYWEQDRKVKLEDWGRKLSDVVFHAKVGMMDAKVARIEKLALEIAKAVGFSDTKSVSRAAQLCKADLTSGMVGEFPELQGIMGRYYANAQGIGKDVAEAIYEHYKPQGANDSLPESPLGAIISVADKMDSITSLFAAGEKPTGSKDPLALRRAALGILRIVQHHGWNIDLMHLVTEKKVAGEIAEFFRDRLNTMLKEDGVRHDIIEASTNAADGSFNPLAITANAKALSDFTVKQQTTLAAIKRTLSILAAEEKKAKAQYQFAAAKKDAFVKPAEQQLFVALQQNVVSLDALAGLAAPINKFFDDVLVTEEGFKDARLSLLAGVRAAANQIADFSKIEG